MIKSKRPISVYKIKSYKEDIDYFYQPRHENIPFSKPIHQIISYYIDKEKGSDIIKNIRKSISADLSTSFGSYEKIIVLDWGTGLSKTTTALKYLNYYCNDKYCKEFFGILGYKFIFLSKQYENGVYNVDDLIHKHKLDKMDYLIFKGKNRLCHRSKEKQIKKSFKDGISIAVKCDEKISPKLLCKNRCEYFLNCKECIYNNKYKNDVKSFITVNHELNKICRIILNLNKQFKYILVFDESFEDGIKENNRYEGSSIIDHLRSLYYISTHLRQRRHKLYKKSKKNKRSLTENTAIIYRKIFKILLKPPIDYDKLMIYLLDLNSLDFSDQYIIQLLSSISKKIHKKKIHYFKFRFNTIYTLAKTLGYRYIKSLIDKKPLSDVENWLKESIAYNNYNKRVNIIFYNTEVLNYIKRLDNVVKIIILNATANIRHIRHFFGDNTIKIYGSDKIKYLNTTFYQLYTLCRRKKDRKYSYYNKISISQNKSTFNHLIECVKLISEKHKKDKILVVIQNIKAKEFKFDTDNKSFYDIILEQGDNISCDHHPLESTNKYSDHNTCITFKPNLRESTYKKQAIHHVDTYEEYKDDYIKSTTKQGFGRILRGSDQKTVYILNAYDLGFDENVEIHKIYGYKNFLNFLRPDPILKRVIEIIKSVGYITLEKYSKEFGCSKVTASKHLSEYLELIISKIYKSSIKRWIYVYTLK